MFKEKRKRKIPDWLKTNFVHLTSTDDRIKQFTKSEAMNTPQVLNENSIKTININRKEDITDIPPKRYCTRSCSTVNNKKEENLEAETEKTVCKPTFVDYSGKIEFHTEFHDIAFYSEQLLQWVNQEKIDEIIPIAFDMEWPFTFTTGPGRTAVIQLCAGLDICYVFHVYNLKKLPASLIQLLIHDKVCLHGVNIKNDFRKLERDFPEVKTQKMIDQCVDLSSYCNKVMNTGGRWSMERLVSYLCRQKINKERNVRMSKWHLLPLSVEQQLYAATDVYISLVMYKKLREHELEKENEAREFIEEFGSEAFKVVQNLQ